MPEAALITGRVRQLLLGVGQHLWFQMGVRRVHLKEGFTQAQLVQGHAHDCPAVFSDADVLYGLPIEPGVGVCVLPDGCSQLPSRLSGW